MSEFETEVVPRLAKSDELSEIIIPFAGKFEEIVPPEHPEQETKFTARANELIEMQLLAVIPDKGIPTAIEFEFNVPRKPIE